MTLLRMKKKNTHFQGPPPFKLKPTLPEAQTKPLSSSKLPVQDEEQARIQTRLETARKATAAFWKTDN